jgi:DNA repair protein RadA/Sms
VLAGELALSGSLRAAPRAERRLAEACRLGFNRLVTGPARGASSPREPHADGELVSVADLRSALRLALQD